MQSPPHLDPVSLLVGFLVAWLAPQTSYQVAAYAAIFAGAATGSLLSHSRREAGVSGWVYVPLMIAATMLVSAGAAEVVAAYTGWRVEAVLAPVALVIATIGHDWSSAHRWLPELWARIRSGGAK